jgi:phosphoserine phosphatase RsbU/P
MKELYSKPPSNGSRSRLECAGVWGGIRNRDLEIQAGKVIGSLYSAACDGGKGGDIYYFGVCKDDKIMRLAIADVVGHGEAVAEVGQFVYNSLRTHMCDMDSQAIMGEINRLVSNRGLEAMTTAAVVAYNGSNGLAYVSYAGHPPVLFKCKADEAWSFSPSPPRDVHAVDIPMNLPLAVDSDALYRHREIPMVPGDRLFVYTDGITEAPNPEGDLFGPARLKDVLDANADASLSELKSAVLQAVLQHTKKGLTHDDVTLIALEIC